jgi:hypothetical protein
LKDLLSAFSSSGVLLSAFQTSEVPFAKLPTPEVLFAKFLTPRVIFPAFPPTPEIPLPVPLFKKIIRRFIKL